MTDFVKGKVFTIAEVRENKDGQILAKVVFWLQLISTQRIFQVEGLIEGYQYSFRVKAVNLGSTVDYFPCLAI